MSGSEFLRSYNLNEDIQAHNEENVFLGHLWRTSYEHIVYRNHFFVNCVPNCIFTADYFEKTFINKCHGACCFYDCNFWMFIYHKVPVKKFSILAGLVTFIVSLEGWKYLGYLILSIGYVFAGFCRHFFRRNYKHELQPQFYITFPHAKTGGIIFFLITPVPNNKIMSNAFLY